MADLQTDGARVLSLWRNEGISSYRKRPRDPGQLAKLMINIDGGEDREAPLAHEAAAARAIGRIRRRTGSGRAANIDASAERLRRQRHQSLMEPARVSKKARSVGQIELLQMQSYPKFHNEIGVPIVRVGCREFECIGAIPPQDHPHIYCEWNRLPLLLHAIPFRSEFGRT